MENLLDITSDNKDLPKYVTKNGLNFMINQKKITILTKKLELKHQCLDQIHVILVMHTLLLKEILLLVKKTFTPNDFEAPNNTVANATATNDGNNNAFGKEKLIFKNNAPFINCITKINGIKIDNAEHLDVVMPMYNLLEYSKNYKKNNRKLVELLER